MSTAISIIIGIAVFFAIIIIHEGGHFFAAKASGIPVSEFAVGMGPAIFQKKKNGTVYSVRAFPIGGYCAMNEDEDIDDEKSFRRQAVWKRMIVIVAGAFMNLVLGFILSFVFFLISGKGITTTVAVFPEENASSHTSGLMVGDEIISVNGLNVFTMSDVIYELTNDEDGIVRMRVKRNGETITLDNVKFEMQTDEETGKPTLVFDFKVYSEEITPANFFRYSVRKFAYDARIVVMTLGDLIKGKYGLNDLSGPVGIVSAISAATSDAEKIDWSYVVEMAMLITINVGIFNLLPLPALEGDSCFSWSKRYAESS